MREYFTCCKFDPLAEFRKKKQLEVIKEAAEERLQKLEMPYEMAEFLLKSMEGIYNILVVHLQDSEIDIEEFYSTNPGRIVKKLLSFE